MPVNAAAVATLAAQCREHEVRLVHLSTDFVFDGSQGRPYLPADAPHPLNVYGATKLEGERNVTAERGRDWGSFERHGSTRPRGRNFLLTMLRLFRERREVRVVADQVGSPTSAGSLAACVWRACLDGGQPEIFHFTDAGVASGTISRLPSTKRRAHWA